MSAGLDLCGLKTNVGKLVELLRCVISEISNTKPIRIQQIQTPSGPVNVTQVTKNLPFSVLNSHLFADTFKTTNFCIHDALDNKLLNEIEEGCKYLNIDTSYKVIDTKKFDAKIAELKAKILSLEIDLNEKKMDIDTLREFVKFKYEAEKKQKTINELLEILCESKNYIKEVAPVELKEENLVKWVLDYVKNCEEYVRQCGEYNMSDYEKVFGEDFNPLMVVLYNLNKKKDGIKDVLITIKRYLDDGLEFKLEEIYTTFKSTSDNIEQFCCQLKSAIKTKGIYVRRVGEITEYYGVTSELHNDYEKYKALAQERLNEIKRLRKKIEELEEPAKEKYTKWFADPGVLGLHDMLQYAKKKMYRKKKVTDLFGEYTYKPGQKFFGLTITYWHYRYLQMKSLEPVLNVNLDNIDTMLKAKYVISALSKLSNIMKCDRAILWVRNKLASKFGRVQAGKHHHLCQQDQDKRFYNTYLFHDDLTLEDFLAMNTESKIKMFQKQYKQLDREIGAKYLGRFYGENAYRAQEERLKTNLAKVATASYYKEQTKTLNICPDYKPKRNPIAALRKITKFVENYCRDRVDYETKNYLLELLKQNIPEMTYGGEDVPKKYVMYCNKMIEKAPSILPILAIEHRSEHSDKILLGLKKAKDERLAEKGKESEESSDYTESSGEDYSDYDSDMY